MFIAQPSWFRLCRLRIERKIGKVWFYHSLQVETLLFGILDSVFKRQKA
jgi:hypothetical protein